MDISIDLTDEVVTDNVEEELAKYLKGKINDIKLFSSENKLINAQKRHDECLATLKNVEKFDSPDLVIVNNWQKIYNGKWIIGYNTENKTQSFGDKINVILNWDLKEDLLYSMKIYTKYKPEACDELNVLKSKSNTSEFEKILGTLSDEIQHSENAIENELIASKTLLNNSTVVILIDIPTFFESKEINIIGVLTYEKCNQKYQKTLPKICLKVSEIISNKFAVQMSKIICGNEEAFLSVLSSGKTTPVKIVIPEGMYRTLEGILQIDCSFSKIEIFSRDTVFIFDGNSEALAHCVIKITQGSNEVKIITKDEQQLYMLFHHLYTNVPGILLLDENSETVNLEANTFLTRPTQFFMDTTAPNQDVLKELVNSFDQQMSYVKNAVEKCLTDQNITSKGLTISDIEGGYTNFRLTLIEMEKNTDELFSKVFNKTA